MLRKVGDGITPTATGIAPGATARPAAARVLFDEHAPLSMFFGLTEVTDERSIGGYINSALPATAAYTTVLWVDLH